MDSDWIDALSILSISAQSFKKCNQVIRLLPAPETLHQTLTTNHSFCNTPVSPRMSCQTDRNSSTGSALQPGAPAPPPPHQPSPGGSTSATPPQGGSDTRGTNREGCLHIRPGTWFTSCQGIGQRALCRPHESLPPGGGVGERAEPAVEPEGGKRHAPLVTIRCPGVPNRFAQNLTRHPPPIEKKSGWG